MSAATSHKKGKKTDHIATIENQIELLKKLVNQHATKRVQHDYAIAKKSKRVAAACGIITGIGLLGYFLRSPSYSHTLIITRTSLLSRFLHAPSGGNNILKDITSASFFGYLTYLLTTYINKFIFNYVATIRSPAYRSLIQERKGIIERLKEYVAQQTIDRAFIGDCVQSLKKNPDELAYLRFCDQLRLINKKHARVVKEILTTAL